jgi:hypothetical protein
MAGDPVFRLAKLRIIKASAELEAQLATKDGGAPAIVILRKLEERAAESLSALAFINLFDPAGVLEAVSLQNEVKRYDEWVVWLRELINEGKQLDQEMTEQGREEILDVLLSTPEGEREAAELGLIDDDQRGRE